MDPLSSPSWHRVAALAPRLRAHARVARHRYRGQTWHVVQDPTSSRTHRLTPAAYHFVALMDGARTVGEVWEVACSRLGDAAPTQDEVIGLLARLHAADLLHGGIAPDAEEVLRRRTGRLRRHRTGRLANPLALRLPLFDPDRLLARLAPLARPLFTPLGAVAWLAVVGLALVLAGLHWSELGAELESRGLTARNLLLLWLVYPVVKALHELGHGVAVKLWGGEVHETGVYLLVLTPVPYVDASSSAGFPEKRRRMVVGAAGIMVELLLAAVAMLAWPSLAPGLARDLAFDVMLIGGVSTVLFNANPLLRFDGYHVLVDAIEIPNLAARSSAYLGYLAQRWLFGLGEARSPVSASGEAAWFVLYGVAAAVYRVGLAFAIALYLAGKMFVVGVALAIWAVVATVVLPLLRCVRFLAVSPALARRRVRAVAVTSIALVALGAAPALVPVPLASRAEGVVWLPEQAQVRAGTDGFVRRVLATPGETVAAGEPLFALEAPLLEARLAVLAAKLAALRARLATEAFRDRVKAAMVRDEIDALEVALERERERERALLVASASDGQFWFDDLHHPLARYVRRGERLGYVVDRARVTVRTVLTQRQIRLVRERPRGVQVRFADRVAHPLVARVAREVPAARLELPSPALGTLGGGRIAVASDDRRGVTPLEPMFQLDLRVPALDRARHRGGTVSVDRPVLVGQRVFVRFDHGREPLVYRWLRDLRGLFLSRLRA